MKIKLLYFFLSLLSLSAFSQDFSNKGKDFWVGYAYHVRYVSGNPFNGQEMVLYFVTDDVTDITVSIPALGYTRTYSNIPANTVFESSPIPKTGGQDARLTSEGLFTKGIHITATKPVVAYSHIYNANVSGATILFPTNTLGKEYYSINYTQRSNEPNSNSFFFVIAADTGKTTVEITPSATTLSHVANVPFTVTLNQGEIYNVMGIETTSGSNIYNGVDLTGSRIRSINTGSTGCKRIAVFSGSGKIFINCGTGQAISSDNLIAQAFPKTAWGQRFLTAPTKNMPYNYFRVAVSDPAALVKVNGIALLSGSLINNFYYDLPLTNQPQLIESDKPIMVSQYITTAGSSGSGTCGNRDPLNSGNSDPEMIYLSSMEQTTDKVILNSTPHYNITEHYVNLIVKSNAVNSLRLDGSTIANQFAAHPSDANYSYAQLSVAQGQHTITADSGFNVIAYGYGGAESYGYNGGTNIKDLYQFISITNPNSIVNTPTACSGSPFYFSITLPYQPISLYWDFHGYKTPNQLQNLPVSDSTYFLNGRQVWRYKLPIQYVYTLGVYPVSVTANNPTPEGCSGEQLIDFDLNVYNPPIADFTYQNNGCVTDSVVFADNSNLNGRPAYRWYWDFGDGTISNSRTVSHKYALPSTYKVRYHLVTDVGCLSDTTSHNITVTFVPQAKFGISSPDCIGRQITFSDSSVVFAPGTLGKWYWDYGDGTIETVTTNANRLHTYNSTGLFTASLKVETTTGCSSTVKSIPVNIHLLPVVDFSLPEVCLPWGSAQFNDLSTIADGTQAGFKYLWDFGDPASGSLNVDSVKNPVHHYNATGPFNVKLKVTSQYGCDVEVTKPFSTIYKATTANFSVNSENCLKDSTVFTDITNANGVTLTNWFWDFGDGQTSILRNPKHLYTTPNTYQVKMFVKTINGCFSDTVTKSVVINPLPAAAFTTSSPVCETKAITFTNSSVANNGSLVKWNWNFGDGNSLNATNGSPFIHTFAAANTYNVKLYVETNKGCRDSVTKPVIVNAQPVANFILPDVCLSDAFAQFLDSSYISDGTQGAFTYSWNFGDPGSGALNASTIKDPKHKYSAIGNYTTILTVTSSSGCVSTISRSFTVNGTSPSANFNLPNTSSLCSNIGIQIQNTSTVDFGDITRIEIYWDNLNNPSAFDADETPYAGKIYTHLYPDFQTPLTKNFTIRFRSFSGGTCVSELKKVVIVNASPKVQFNSIPDICNYTIPYQITQASETGAVPGSGAYSGTAVSPGGVFDPVAAGPGTYTIRYTFTSNKGCVDYKESTIKVWVPPVALFGFSSPTCETKAVTFSDSSTAVIGNIVNRIWNFNDGTPIITRNSGASFMHIFTLSGTYNVTLTVVTNNGCNSKVYQKQVVINPNPKVLFSASVTCLPAASVQFTDRSTIADGSESALSYLWNFGDPGSGVSNTSILKNPVHIYNAVGPYTVTLQVTSSSGCTSVNTLIYNDIHPQPIADFISDVTETCVNSNILFTDKSIGADAVVNTWNWSFGDGNTSTSQNPLHSYTNQNPYTVTLIVKNTNGCISNPFSKTVNIFNYPVVDAGPDHELLEDETIVLQPNVSGIGLSYLWTPNLFLNNNTVLNPVLTGTQDQLYKLTVTGSGNCSASDNMFVKVLKTPRIPNTFTPNNDGVNDLWVIEHLKFYKNSRVQVFNRYGQLVFESIGYTTPWDGSIKGKGLPIGTYYYVIEPGNGRKPITGYVTILK